MPISLRRTAMQLLPICTNGKNMVRRTCPRIQIPQLRVVTLQYRPLQKLRRPLASTARNRVCASPFQTSLSTCQSIPCGQRYKNAGEQTSGTLRKANGMSVKHEVIFTHIVSTSRVDISTSTRKSVHFCPHQIALVRFFLKMSTVLFLFHSADEIERDCAHSIALPTFSRVI